MKGEQNHSRLTPATLLLSPWASALVILLAVTAVYGQTLWFEFVSYDDYDLVVANGDFLSKPSNVLTSFTTHAFTSHRAESAYYRPLLLISFIADYQLWGLHPAGYHLTNLLLHALASVICFLIIRRLLGGTLFPLIGGLLFAMHPIQTESVAWIAGRNDVMLGLFILLMVFWHICACGDREKRLRYHVLSVLAFLAAVLTKEPAVFFFLLIPLYDLGRGGKPVWLLLREHRVLYGAMATIIASYLLARMFIFGELIGAERLYGVLPLALRIKFVPAMVAEYLGMLVMPVHQSVARPLENLSWMDPPWSLGAILITLLLPVLLIISWKRIPPIGYGLAWISVGLVPLLNVIPVAVAILEHRMYSVMAGSVIALSGLFSMRGWNPRLSALIGGGLIIMAATASLLRIPVWRDSNTLWSDAIQKAPNSTRAYFSLAGYWYEQGEYVKTIRFLEQYLHLKPDDAVGWSKLQETYVLAGNSREVAETARRLIAITPRNPERYLDAGVLFERLHLPDTAVAIYRQGLGVDSTMFELYARMGKVEEEMGHRDLALQYYQTAIGRIESLSRTMAPPPDVLGLLASLYERTGNQGRAAEIRRQLVP